MAQKYIFIAISFYCNLLGQIKISYYTEYKVFGPSLIYKKFMPVQANFIIGGLFSSELTHLYSKYWSKDLISSQYVSFYLQIRCLMSLELICDSHFQRAFTACLGIFKVITLVGSNRHNYFENANGCSKPSLKTTVTTQYKIVGRL